MAAGASVTDCWGVAWSAELVLEVCAGKAAAGKVMVTPADAQNCWANERVAAEMAH